MLHFAIAQVGHILLTLLIQGAFFGEMALLDNAERHMASVRVVTFCDGFCMSRQSYQVILHSNSSATQLQWHVIVRVPQARTKSFSSKVHIRSVVPQALVKDYPSVREYLESVAKLRLAASLESSLGASQDSPGQPDTPDFADQDLRSLVNTVKTSGYAMAPIHQVR